VPRWAKILLGIVAVLVVLLLINALVVSNATKSAYVRNDGAKLIDTSSGTLQVLDQGDRRGSPIVLLHCYTCSVYWWDRLAPLLEHDHRVLRIDLLGHGGSDKPGAGYSMQNQATAVAEALARLGVVNATVVGHSLGGIVATALAEQSPRLASRIVILDSGPTNNGSESLGERIGYWPVFGQAEYRLAHIAPKSAIGNQYDQAFAPGFSRPEGFQNPDQPVDDLRAMTYTAYQDSHDAADDFVGERSLPERLAATHLPVMVLFGAEDQVFDAQDAIARYRASLPGVQTHLIPGAGHSPNVERPNLVAPLILAFARTPKPLKPRGK
jgi:pimeloyl-ACP methyl ester carboxylesterase